MKWFDQLEGRTKLVTCFVLSLIMFWFKYYWQYILVFFALSMIIVFSFNKFQKKQLIKHWKLLLFLPLINLFVNLFFINGTEIWSWGWFHLTELDIQITARLFLISLIAIILIIKSTPQEMAIAVGKIANSLTFGKYHGIGLPLVVIIMASFIDDFRQTFITVLRANTIRNSGCKSILDMIFLLQPIMIIALKKADRMSDALIAKCYHRDAQIFNYHDVKYQSIDKIVYLGLVVLIIVEFTLIHI